ncbi:RimJ/RimL family protein N-acetyltransferase [Neorhizobium huautlense]|uniref:RimJ/RimL family protein N-acetyltransferase n=1 Tax=Neorhizobium huautlense TaxID=67774 RepID=A0ABT9PZP2_9HYPH|nr:GNAT family N-acetyltransferase [Neorhizobium huautlense]MDP9839951.1 RimJ/RimL family protein N-acetyltransferase [Neorhizobium huautlense]
MTENILIEPIGENHVEGFREALDIVARERKYLVFQEAPPIEAMLSFVRDNIAAGHPHMVAVADGKVVGWCDIRRGARDAEAHSGVLGMGIIPGYRDRGLGRKLMLATLEAAKAAGLHRVELHAHADNFRAIALYEKVGFVHEGVARHAIRIEGRYIDSVLMALIFE